MTSGSSKLKSVYSQDMISVHMSGEHFGSMSNVSASCPCSLQTFDTLLVPQQMSQIRICFIFQVVWFRMKWPHDVHLLFIVYSREIYLWSVQPVARVESVVSSCHLGRAVPPDDLGPSARSLRDLCGYKGVWACNYCWSIFVCAFGKVRRTYSNRGLRMVLPARRPLFSAALFEDFQ